jgi:putative aminopeptidase FrvX
MFEKWYRYLFIELAIILISAILICSQPVHVSKEKGKSITLELLEELVGIPGPSRHEGAVARRMAEIMESWDIPVSLDSEENWVIGSIPGSGPKISLIAHIDEPGFFLTKVDNKNTATFHGVFFAPVWNRAELAKFLTYEELSEAPVIRNPDGEAILELYVPGWDASFPLLSWKAGSVKHQHITVHLNKEQAKAARAALRTGDRINAINKNGLYRVSDPLLGEMVIGSPLDNRVSMALILSLAYHYKDLAIEVRPNLYIVGRPREEMGASLRIPDIADSDLVVVVDPPAMHFYSALGGGPVIIWNQERTPEWLVDIFMKLPRHEGLSDFPPTKRRKESFFKDEVQVFKAKVQGLLTVAIDDAGPNVPCFYIGPTMLRYHTSQEKMAVTDIEECEKLMIALLDHIAKRIIGEPASTELRRI